MCLHISDLCTAHLAQWRLHTPYACLTCDAGRTVCRSPCVNAHARGIPGGTGAKERGMSALFGQKCALWHAPGRIRRDSSGKTLDVSSRAHGVRARYAPCEGARPPWADPHTILVHTLLGTEPSRHRRCHRTASACIFCENTKAALPTPSWRDQPPALSRARGGSRSRRHFLLAELHVAHGLGHRVAPERLAQLLV